MRKGLLVFLYVFLGCFFTKAQNDSISACQQEKKCFFKQQILPLSLIASGSLLNIGDVKLDIQNNIPNTDIHIDDYIQYAPIAQLYLYDAIGFSHQNSVFDQTKYLVLSQLLSASTVLVMKNIFDVERPTGWKHSFPSRHTNNTFVNATVLFLEFKDTEPLLAYSGFVFATATGVLRMTNNAHWLPDVLVGAGIGILTTNLVYYFKPFQGFQPFKRNLNIAVIPLVGARFVGLQCRF